MNKTFDLKRVLTPLVVTIFLGLSMTGCGSDTGSSTNTPASNTSTTSASPKSAEPAASPKSSETTASTSGDKIGVPECDEYITKYEACIKSKVPEASRAQMLAAFDAARKGYKAAAATPQGKATLAQSCTAALNASKQATSAYGCSW
jgi:hypothetical protein